MRAGLADLAKDPVRRRRVVALGAPHDLPADVVGTGVGTAAVSSTSMPASDPSRTAPPSRRSSANDKVIPPEHKPAAWTDKRAQPPATFLPGAPNLSAIELHELSGRAYARG